MKKIYYEVIEGDKVGAEKTEADEKKADDVIGAGESDEKSEVAETVKTVEPIRDEYAELIQAAKNTNKVRFFVRISNKNSFQIFAFAFAAIVIAGGSIMAFTKTQTAIIVTSSIMLTLMVGAIAAMIAFAVNAKKSFPCYYVNDGNTVFSACFMDERAIVLINDVAYRIEGDAFYSLDFDGYLDYLDGETTGVLSVLTAKRGDVEVLGDGMFKIKGRLGGGNTVLINDGKIKEITSEQASKSDEIDPKTGRAKIRTEVFIKTDPTQDFNIILPDYAKKRFRERNIDIESLLPKL